MSTDQELEQLLRVIGSDAKLFRETFKNQVDSVARAKRNYFLHKVGWLTLLWVSIIASMLSIGCFFWAVTATHEAGVSARARESSEDAAKVRYDALLAVKERYRLYLLENKIDPENGSKW